MKSQCPDRSIIFKARQLPAIQWLYLAFLLMSIFACEQKATVKESLPPPPPIPIATVDPSDLPPPIKARILNKDSIAPPEEIPLMYEPEVVPAHPNVHPIGRPEVYQIPEDLKVVVIGKDVPLPEIILANPRITPVYQPKPVPAYQSRMTEAAIFNIQYLSGDEGLPFGGKSIIEDSRGHIWAGGPRGAVRYDGVNFFPYTEQEGIFGGFVMLEDRKRNIWFGGPDGGGYYDGKQVVDFRDQEGLKNNWWNSIMEDSRGHIWIGTDKGLFRYDGKSFTFFKKENILYSEVESKDGMFFDNRINAMLEDSRGDLWWATQGSGVLRYDGKRIVQYTTREGLVDNFISSILEDSQGRVWFGSGGEGLPIGEGKGVSVYTPDTKPDQKKGGTFSNYTTREGLSGNRITGMVKDDDRNIWISTYSNGLTCYERESKNPDSYRGRGNFIHYSTEEGLSHTNVNSILKDHQNNIWVSLNNGRGLNRFKFNNSFRNFTQAQGLSSNWINSLMEDQSGNIWLAGCYSGLIKYDGLNFTNYSAEEELLKDCLEPLLEDEQGNFWLGARDRGVFQFDGKVFRRFGEEQGFTNPYYFYVPTHLDQQGRIWFSSFSNPNVFDGTAIRYDPENGEVTHFTDGMEESIGGVSIFEDRQHNLWFSGLGCIAKYDPVNDQLNYVLQLELENPHWLHILMDDEEGNLWFSMENDTRIFKMKKEGDDFTISAFTEAHGFPDITIRTVAVDDKENAWFTNQESIGVIRSLPEKNGSVPPVLTHFSKRDGLKGKFYGQHSVTIDHKNRLWAGSSDNGVSLLNLNAFEFPDEAPENLNLSQLDIRQQFIDYGSLQDSTYRSTLAFGAVIDGSFDSISTFRNYPVNLTLPYNFNHLTFHFSATDWKAPYQIQYSYKIEGVDRDWSPSSSESKADYRNLPPGKHTFQVRSKGEAQVWSELLEYTFTIRPPWWFTWWAYCLYALLAVGLVGSYILRLRQKIKEKEKQLERERYLNRELQELNIATTRFVPKDFVQTLNKNSLKELQLGDQMEATMTILFADIRSYTSLSEQMTPQENFKFINAFLGRIGPIIKEHGGFICQYYGDGIMALFKNEHDKAVKAAIEMQKKLRHYNRQRFARNRKPIHVGIGLNTGQLMLGVIGDSKRYDAGVISDAVNIASRMEGLTKIFGAQVIVSEKTLQELELFDKIDGPDTLAGDYRFLGKVKVKGKDKVLKIYEFYDGHVEEIRRLKSETKVYFEQALEYYYEREFGKAADLYKVILEKYPEDIATKYYMDKAVKYVLEGVEENWNGVEEMVSK